MMSEVWGSHLDDVRGVGQGSVEERAAARRVRLRVAERRRRAGGQCEGAQEAGPAVLTEEQEEGQEEQERRQEKRGEEISVDFMLMGTNTLNQTLTADWLWRSNRKAGCSVIGW